MIVIVISRWKVNVSISYNRPPDHFTPPLLTRFNQNHLLCRDIDGSKCVPYDNSFEGEGRKKCKDVPSEHEITVKVNFMVVFDHLMILHHIYHFCSTDKNVAFIYASHKSVNIATKQILR